MLSFKDDAVVAAVGDEGSGDSVTLIPAPPNERIEGPSMGDVMAIPPVKMLVETFLRGILYGEERVVLLERVSAEEGSEDEDEELVGEASELASRFCTCDVDGINDFSRRLLGTRAGEVKGVKI